MSRIQYKTKSDFGRKRTIFLLRVFSSRAGGYLNGGGAKTPK